MTSDELHIHWRELLRLADQRRACRGASYAAPESESALSLLPDRLAADLFNLYGNIACGRSLRAGSLTVAHLGQSIDGCIATASGHSLYVTGQANLVHLHRLRALSDAIVVGAGTCAADDPRLTTRLVQGPSPVRVVLDREATLPARLTMFNDQRAETLVVCAEGRIPASVSPEHTVHVPLVDGRLSLPAVRDALERRGLQVLFVEGGGVTVTHFVEAGLVDRLHVAIAPVLIGLGRRGIALPSAVDMTTALRPAAQLYRMGEDVLWDLDLSTSSHEGAEPAGHDWPQRIL